MSASGGSATAAADATAAAPPSDHVQDPKSPDSGTMQVLTGTEDKPEEETMAFEQGNHEDPAMSSHELVTDETLTQEAKESEAAQAEPSAALDQDADEDAAEDEGDISLVGSPKVASEALAGTSFSSHRRIDSLPPQKYNVARDATAGLTASLASTSLGQAIQEEEADMSTPQFDDSSDVDLNPRSSSAQRPLDQQHDSFPPSHPVVIDKADLNFVDITLDPPEDPAPRGSNLVEPPNPLAGSGKTAEQIRNDQISSQDLQTPSSSAMPASDSTPAARSRLSVHGPSPPDSPESDEGVGNRNVEGRYRGRRSAPSSRAASPTRAPSRSPARRASNTASQVQGDAPLVTESANKNGLSIQPAPALLTADENGNISVIPDSLVSPRTAVRPDQDSREGEATSRSTEGSTKAAALEGSSASNGATVQPAQRTIETGGKAATSLSEEVEAIEAAEASEAPTSNIENQEASSSTPPNGVSLSATTAPGLTDKADQVDPKNRRKSSSAGANPVDSRTRMTTLPAKKKDEEIKHRADFERMMIAAKEAERKKREDEEERKRQRQDEQREALGRWEKEILPSWSRARKDPELEQLWWKGAPPSIRGRVWALAIGNPLMLSRNLLEQSEKKAAAKGPIQGTIPPRVLAQINEDVEDTLPSLRLFQTNGPLHDDLVRICRAFVLVRIDQLAQLDLAGNANKAASQLQNASPVTRKFELGPVSGSGEPSASTHNDSATERYEPEDEYARRGIDIYQPGLANLAGVLLINMSANTAFIALLNLIESKPWLKALYSLLPTLVSPSAPTSPVKTRAPSIASTTRTPGTAYTLPPKDKAIRGFERVLETLLGDQMPKAYANLLGHNVRLYRTVLRDWVGTLWSRWLDVDTVMRVWDVVLLDETDSMIYRVCLALVQMLESRLYVPDQEELETILRGTNRAALAVWRREKEMKGELEVHARGLTSPRHSRSSVSSIPQQTPEPKPNDSPLPQSQPSATSLASNTDTEVDTTDDIEEAIIPRDYIYEQYAIQEHHIFDTLEAQRSWWKQSTLQRLLERELSE